MTGKARPRRSSRRRRRALLPWWVLPVLMLALLMLVALPWLLTGRAPLMAPDALLAKAEHQLAVGDLPAAAESLRQVLTVAPQTAYARWLYGELQTRLGDWMLAEKQYRLALDLGLSENSALVPLALALLMQGKHGELLELAAPPVLGANARASLAALKSQAALARGDAFAARDWLDQARALGDGGVATALAEARLLEADGQPEAAARLLTETVERWPDSTLAWHARGELAARYGDLALARECFATLAERNPSSPRWTMDHALALIGQGLVEAAAPLVEQMLAQDPHSVASAYAAGRLAAAQGDHDAALSHFEAVLALEPLNAEALYHHGAALVQLGQLDSGLRNLRRALDAEPGLYGPSLLLANQALLARDYAAAAAQLQGAFARGLWDVAGLGLYAGALIGQGRSARAVALLRELVGSRRGGGTERERLALALIAAGQLDAAAAELARLVLLEPQRLLGETWLIRALVATGASEQALARAGALQARLPGEPLVLLLLAEVYAALGEAGSAQTLVSAVQAEAPVRSSVRRAAVLAHARAAVTAGESAQALALLEAHLQTDPRDLAAMYLLAQVQVGAGAPAAAGAWLQQAVEEAPADLDALLALARWLIEAGQAVEAIDPLRVALDSHPQRVELLSVLATALLADDGAEAAWHLARRAERLAPDDPRVRYLKARALMALGESARAATALEAVLQTQPGLALARRDLLAMRLATGDLADAARLASDLRVAFADDPTLLLLSGQRALLAERPAAARHWLDLALAQGAGRAALLALGWLAARQGDLDTAIALYRDWLEATPEDSQVRLALANALLTAGEDAAAQAQWEAVLAHDPGNLVALNNLAWSLLTVAPRRALALAEAAQVLAPRQAAVADTLAAAQRGTGAWLAAERTLARALVQHPGHTGLMLQRAEVLLQAQQAQALGTQLGPLLTAPLAAPARGRALDLLGRLPADAWAVLVAQILRHRPTAPALHDWVALHP